jgi:hypothetical protein
LREFQEGAVLDTRGGEGNLMPVAQKLDAAGTVQQRNPGGRGFGAIRKRGNLDGKNAVGGVQNDSIRNIGSAPEFDGNGLVRRWRRVETQLTRGKRDKGTEPPQVA